MSHDESSRCVVPKQRRRLGHIAHQQRGTIGYKTFQEKDEPFLKIAIAAAEIGDVAAVLSTFPKSLERSD